MTLRRCRLATLALGVAVLLAACADDASPDTPTSAADAPGSSPSDTGPGTSAPSAGPGAATSTTAAPATPPPPAPPALAAPEPLSADTHGLTGTLDQYREDVANDLIRIRVENPGDSVIEISTLRLAWPGLEPVAPEAVDFDVQPRMKVGLTVPYGDAVCSDPPQVAAEVPQVPIAAVAETNLGTITFPVTDPLEVLRRLYQPGCERQAVADAVDIRFGTDWTEVPVTGGGRLDGTLVLTRTDAPVEVAVTGLSGSVLLLLDAPGLPAVLPAGEERLVVPVSVTNARCDGHALGESKQTYLFQLGLTVGGAEASVVLVPDPDTRTRLFDGVIARCPPTVGVDD